MKHLQNIEIILQKEEARRKRRSWLLGVPEFLKSDCKGEALELYRLMAELSRELNANNREKIQELCILANRRLKLIYQFYKS